MVSSVAGKILIPNLTSEPHFLKRNKHFCQVHALYTPEEDSTNEQLPVSLPPRPPVHQPAQNTENVSLDPNNLHPQGIRAKFTSLLDEYDHIFDPNIKGYNGAEGPFKVRVNMGPVKPPQRKGRLP